MNTNVKEVRFGTKQEAVITPKAGYELERVEVVNTADNSFVPAELNQTSDAPVQYICTFLQPAGHVTIRPIVRPILYSVTVEVPEECNVVLVEMDSPADIAIKSALGHEENASGEVPKGVEPDEDFNQPQHSFEKQSEQGLSVGEEELKPEESDLVPENTVSEGAPAAQGDTAPMEQQAANGGSSSQAECVVCLEVDEDDEPIIMTQAEHDKKMALYWQYREAANAGKITPEEFAKVKKRHIEFCDKVTSGKIKIVDSLDG